MTAIALGQLTALILLGGIAAAAVYFRSELARARSITLALRRRLLATAFTGGAVAAMGMGRVALAAPGTVVGLVATVTALAGAGLALMCVYAALSTRRVV